MESNGMSKAEVRTKIIEPSELQGIVTVPQCIDNQFVTESLFYRMVKKKRPLSDIVLSVIRSQSDDPGKPAKDEDADDLWEAQKTEYNRSLLFSRNIVVNRAAFWNTPVLIAAAIGKESNEFAELIRRGIILPFLLGEKSFDDEPGNFTKLSNYSKSAINNIVDRLALSDEKEKRDFDVTSVKFHHDEEKNKLDIAKFARRFRGELQAPITAGEQRRLVLDRMAQVLMKDETPDDIKSLSSLLMEISIQVNTWLIEEKVVNREQIYEKWVCQPGTSIADGYYRNDTYTFQIKKWIDSIYCANLPSWLGALTFVPKGFPTAYDLGATWTLNANKRKIDGGSEIFNEVIDRAKNASTWKLWNTFQQQADIYIPSPHELTHADILEIRDWHIWKEMMGNLELFVDCKISNEKMLDSYRAFNEALADWWLQKNSGKMVVQAEKFSLAVGIVYQLREFLFGIIRTTHGDFPILPNPDIEIPKLDQEGVKWGVAAGLFAISKQGIDWKRTQLIQKMQNEMTVTSESIQTTIKEMLTVFPELEGRLPRIKPSDFSEAEG